MCFPSEHKFASVDKPHTLWGLQWKPGNKIWQYLENDFLKGNQSRHSGLCGFVSCFAAISLTWDLILYPQRGLGRPSLLVPLTPQLWPQQADESVPAAYLVTGTKPNKGSLRKQEYSGLTAPGGSPARKGGQSCRSLSHLVTLSQQSGSRERRTWGLRSLPLLFEVSALHPTCRAGPPISTNLI